MKTKTFEQTIILQLKLFVFATEDSGGMFVSVSEESQGVPPNAHVPVYVTQR